MIKKIRDQIAKSLYSLDTMLIRRLLLVFFTFITLYAQGYSLVSGIELASSAAEALKSMQMQEKVSGKLEDISDTDPEDIVTLDPFLPSQCSFNSIAESLGKLISVVSFLSLLFTLSLSLATLMGQSLKSKFGAANLTTLSPPGNLPTWLRLRHLLN
ncbi:MAG: hypothetical protein K2Y32_23210 [Candidatus Obscuribacterales bacterium]|nr:hypothetical protein [Candidatus Obscuribacterales bacterium]